MAWFIALSTRIRFSPLPPSLPPHFQTAVYHFFHALQDLRQANTAQPAHRNFLGRCRVGNGGDSDGEEPAEAYYRPNNLPFRSYILYSNYFVYFFLCLLLSMLVAVLIIRYTSTCFTSSRSDSTYTIVTVVIDVTVGVRSACLKQFVSTVLNEMHETVDISMTNLLKWASNMCILKKTMACVLYYSRKVQFRKLPATTTVFSDECAWT